MSTPTTLGEDGHERHLDAAAEIAAAAASSVDELGSFPPAIEYLRSSGLLVPRDVTSSVELVTEIAQALGGECGSSALIWTMHGSQLFSIVRHLGHQPTRRRLFEEQPLIASVLAAAGAARRPATLGREGDHFVVRVDAGLASYTEQAGAFLVACQPSDGLREAVPEDTFVLVWADQVDAIDHGHPWTGLGIRAAGPREIAFSARVEATQLLCPVDIALANTMAPCAHTFWASAWLGSARRATSVARRACRGGRATPAHRTALAGLHSDLALLQSHVDVAGRRLRRHLAHDGAVVDAVTSIRLQYHFNELKIRASELAQSIVLGSLAVTGLRGYTRDTELSLERAVRDVLAAPLMISNHSMTHELSNLLMSPAFARSRMERRTALGRSDELDPS